ncbi:hypothetical protein AURDEDRAFT_169359 [Auricularia subglabra TFB-10046 SS5]|nr:hypothetical protein AURDEDRAFT_169359 [Auricularia subglabra TFB-10046 SS5]
MDLELPPFDELPISPPPYSLLALPDERTLLKSSSTSAQVEPRDARLAFGSPAGTVTFLSQPRGAVMPTYGRNAVIEGEVQLHARERIVGVQLRIEGQVTLQLGSGTEEQPFLALGHKLDGGAGPTQSFSMSLPHTFDDDGTERSLPPSFRYAGEDLRVEVQYRCVVVVTLARSFPGLTQTQKLSIPLSYHPRLRPPRPAMEPEHTFLSTVKAAPGEWTGTGFRMDALRPGHPALHCDVVFPSSRIYAPRQRVPAHVQISATSQIGPGTSHSQQAAAWNMTPSLVLERRITVSALSGATCSIMRLGDALLRPMGGDEWMAWEGEFQVGPCDAASFRVGPVTVSDHLVFAVSAKGGAPYESRQLSIPVRIVTDPFPTEDAV